MYLYEITNHSNGKRYVGITVDIKRRWREHYWELSSNRHHNKFLQYSWTKYGKDSFSFSIVSKFNSLDDMNKAEVEYIKENNLLNSKFGYNLDKGGGSSIHTEKTKKAISKAQEVAVINKCLSTGVEKIYNRIKDVELDGFNAKSIANPCTGRALTYKKHVWMYLVEYNENPEELNRRLNSYQNVKARPSRYRKVYGMNIQTKEMISYDAVYHSKKDGFSYQTVNKCCVYPDINKSHKGFVWSFDSKTLNEKVLIVLSNKTHKIRNRNGRS